MKKYQITKSDLVYSLKTSGIEAGDVLFLHIDAMVASLVDGDSIENKLATVLSAIKEVVTTDGTIIIPTFTYSFCKKMPFSLQDTLCDVKEMGLMPNFFLSQPDTVRTLDPIFSVGIWGKLSDELRTTSGRESFGKESIFAKLAQLNGKIFCLGCSLDRATFIHYCEKQIGVKYRFDKDFSGEIIMPDGTTQSFVTTYFVRDFNLKLTTDLTALKDALRSKDLMRIGSVSRIGTFCVKAQDFYNEAEYLIKNSPFILTKPDSSL